MGIRWAFDGHSMGATCIAKSLKLVSVLTCTLLLISEGLSTKLTDFVGKRSGRQIAICHHGGLSPNFSHDDAKDYSLIPPPLAIKRRYPGEAKDR